MVFLTRMLNAELCKQSLMALRKSTGNSFQHCKKALEHTNNDVKLAAAWLEAESVKQGWTKLERSEGRATQEGVLAMAGGALPRLVAVTEVNCETDFVARNAELRGFAQKVSEAVCQDMSAKVPAGGMQAFPGDQLSKIVMDGQSVEQACVKLVSKVGEKLGLRQSLLMAAAEGEKLAACCHPDPEFGKFGAVLLYKGGSEEIANKICRHIIGMKPSAVGSLAVEEQEVDQESAQDAAAQDKDSNEEQADRNNDNEAVLTLQDFVFDQEKTVGDLLRENNMQITRFWRFECGQEVTQSRD